MLTVQSLSLRIDQKDILSDVSFAMPAGNSLAILGPSASGKTSLLRSIVGLEVPQRGRVIWNEQILSKDGSSVISVEKRRFGMVFQDSALFPHLNVKENVMFGLRHLERAERETRAKLWLERLNLDLMPNRTVHNLSGGERQRVALARAMAADPLVLLLDEPFSHVDRLDRLRLIATMREIFLQSTTIPLLVTHDARDAFELTQNILLLQNGQVVQTGKMQEVIENPKTPWVSEFLAQGITFPG